MRYDKNTVNIRIIYAAQIKGYSKALENIVTRAMPQSKAFNKIWKTVVLKNSQSRKFHQTPNKKLVVEFCFCKAAGCEL